LLLMLVAAAFRQRINDVAFWIDDHSMLSTEDARLFVKFTILVGASVPFAWIGTSRIVRAQVLAIRESAYISAAESMGASTGRIVFRHILPGVLPVFLVGLSGGMAGIAGAEVALSFIGLGIDPPTASFGNLIADAGFVRTFQQYPHMPLGSAIP
jgi:ABC-type dipeptide/oligopeptide/nickel transport system permease subunit